MMVQSQPWKVVHETLSRKHPHKKRAGGVAQGVGPEFKPQYIYIYVLACFLIHCIYLFIYIYILNSKTVKKVEKGNGFQSKGHPCLA
jgi:hypothetical protein